MSSDRDQQLLDRDACAAEVSEIVKVCEWISTNLDARVSRDIACDIIYFFDFNLLICHRY